MIVQRLTAALASALFLAAPALAGEGCPADRAVYTLKDQPAVTAGFAPAHHFASMASDLYFFVTTSQATYWFTMTVSNGYSNLYLLPVSDPYAPEAEPDGPGAVGNEDTIDLALYIMSLDWDVALDPPNKGEPAPARLFVPELGPTLWYAASSLRTEKSLTRDAIDRAVFLYSECLSEPRKLAFP